MTATLDRSAPVRAVVPAAQRVHPEEADARYEQMDRSQARRAPQAVVTEAQARVERWALDATLVYYGGYYVQGRETSERIGGRLNPWAATAEVLETEVLPFAEEGSFVMLRLERRFAKALKGGWGALDEFEQSMVQPSQYDDFNRLQEIGEELINRGVRLYTKYTDYEDAKLVLDTHRPALSA